MAMFPQQKPAAFAGGISDIFCFSSYSAACLWQTGDPLPALFGKKNKLVVMVLFNNSKFH